IAIDQSRGALVMVGLLARRMADLLHVLEAEPAEIQLPAKSMDRGSSGSADRVVIIVCQGEPEHVDKLGLDLCARLSRRGVPPPAHGDDLVIWPLARLVGGHNDPVQHRERTTRIYASVCLELCHILLLANANTISPLTTNIPRRFPT